jgi:hypothetical protein
MVLFGKVIIVTNAKQGWVEYSSYFMLPRVHALIDRYIQIISAQQKFSATHDMDMWKQECFQHLWDIEGLLSKQQETLLHLFVVGDSEYEIKAGKQFRTSMRYGRKCLIKLVKMKELPSPEDIEKQLLLLLSKFDEIACS